MGLFWGVYVFLLLGAKQRSCETTIVILHFPIIIAHSYFGIAGSSALAPPTGASCTCIHVYNFWPIHPIFTKNVSLESLDQMLSNHLETWHRWSSGHAWEKSSNGFFKLKMYWKIWPQSHQTLTYHNQTWYIDPWHHHGDTQTIWWPLTSGGRQTGSELISLQGLHVSKQNLAHSLMHTYPDDAQIIWHHQRLGGRC